MLYKIEIHGWDTLCLYILLMSNASCILIILDFFFRMTLEARGV